MPRPKPKPYQKPWTIDEIDFVRKWAGHYSTREIANFLPGRTKNMVIGKMHRLGINPGHAWYRKGGRQHMRHGGILKLPADKLAHFEPKTAPKRLPLPYEK